MKLESTENAEPNPHPKKHDGIWREECGGDRHCMKRICGKLRG